MKDFFLQGINKRKVVIQLVIIVVFGALLGVYASETFSNDQDEEIVESDWLHILVLGIDKRGTLYDDTGQSGNNGQSDALIVVSIEQDTGEIVLTHIPRETIVEIDIYTGDMSYMGSEEAQICLQYAYGSDPKKGARLVTEKVEELLGIHISYYVTVSLASIDVIVDDFDGVSIAMSQDYVITPYGENIIY